MKDTIPDEKIKEIVDTLEQCTLALKLYVGTRKPRYALKLGRAVKQLHQLLTEEKRLDAGT